MAYSVMETDSRISFCLSRRIDGSWSKLCEAGAYDKFAGRLDNLPRSQILCDWLK